MRYINTRHIDVPDNWVDLAKIQLGNTYTYLWSYFKPNFEAIVGKKCWYSESSNIGTNNPIDHFRPKAAILKALPQYSQISSIINRINFSAGKGYPFLKFDFSNYRYACDIVNSANKKETKDDISRGKWDYFPIEINSFRATSKEQIAKEEICFLDPCIEGDPELLTFNKLGLVEQHESVLKNSWNYCKTLVSIEVFHLHYPHFCERRIEIWQKCETHIIFAEALYQKNPKSKEEQDNLTNRIEELLKKINKKSEFSAVAIDCIRHYKKMDSYSWLNTFFTDEMLKK